MLGHFGLLVFYQILKMDQLKSFGPGQGHEKNFKRIKGGLVHTLMMNHDTAPP
jgi:hypothetical protein